MASNVTSQSSKALTGENLTLKAYEKKVKEDIKLIHENLNEMLKLIKIEDEKTSRVRKKFLFVHKEFFHFQNLFY